MGDYVLFQMWGPFRQQLISNHEFYVGEAKSRLLDQFTDAHMQAESQRLADDWLTRQSANFDPDRHDPGAFYEQAYDEGVAFYFALNDLKKVTLLSIIAGMYHEWEKQLRDWLSRELQRVAPGEHLRLAIWREPVGNIIDFLECWGWPVTLRPYFPDLHLCHLVINVYKHGAGSSLHELGTLAPELLGHDPERPRLFTSALDHTHLTLEEAHLSRFSGAISDFWRDVPENTFVSQISSEPGWLEKAVIKDAAARVG